MAKGNIEQAEIVAPYELPEGWKWVKIGDICKTFADGDWIESKDQSTTGIRLVQTGNIGNGNFRDKEDKYHYISENTFSKLKCTEIFPGDILISRLPEPVGRSCIIPDLKYKMITAVDCTIVRLSENISCKKWFCYYTQSHVYAGLIHERCTGTTRLRISRKNLGEIPFPLPPTLAEQKRIVSRIETLFAKLDEAEEKARAVLDSFETRKATILHKAFTGELTANWRKENGVSDDSWEEKKIGDICTVVRGGSPRPAGDPKYYDGSIPFMKVADITGNDSKYVYSTEYTIKEAGLHKTRMVDSGTLLLTNSGATLGVPAITMIKTTFNDGIAAFLDLPEESNLYFYYFWTSKTSELRAINMGAAQPNLNIDIIKSVRVSVPTIAEQQEIVHILDTVLEKERTAKSAAEQVLEQIDLLKKSILARAFRGEL